jgi:hypothetical protein
VISWSFYAKRRLAKRQGYVASHPAGKQSYAPGN